MFGEASNYRWPFAVGLQEFGRQAPALTPKANIDSSDAILRRSRSFLGSSQYFSRPRSGSDCRSTAGAYAPATVDAPKINRICKGPANHRFENHGIAQGEPVSSAHHRCEALGNATA